MVPIRRKLVGAAVLAAGLLAATLTLTGPIGAGNQSGQAGAVRATLRTASQPNALAVFVGSLRGQTLSWRLTYHGLGGAARWAQLRVAGRSQRLCAPCSSAASGKVTLSAPAARAAGAGSAFVDLRSARGTIHGKLALGTVPTLQLVGLADGAVLKLPAVVHYVVTGFRVAPGAGRVAGYSGERQIVPPTAPEPSTFVLPDDKMLSGRRDLTFALSDASGRQLTNVEATVRVYDVLLAGRR